MPSGNNEYGSKAVLPRDRFTIHILYSFFTEKPRPSGRGFFVSILIHLWLAFFTAGIISSAQMHLYLALFHCRDYFFRPDSSPACFFVPQGLFLPLRCISILLFFSSGIISAARIHLYLALFHCRDYFFRPGSSPACSFLPQGLFLPLRFISILLFFSTGIISAARIHPQLAFFTTGIISIVQIHLYLAFFLHRDYCDRPASSLSCSFSPQGLFPPPGFIPILLFSSAGIISSARIHLYLALFLRRDYFFRPDSSLSCSSVLQGLFRPLGFILILLFFSTGIIATARIHLYLALFLRRDYCDRSDSSLSCSFSPQGLFRPLGFISILLFFTTGIIATIRIHLYLALLCRRDDFFRSDSSLSCSFLPQGLFPPPGFIPGLLFFSAEMIATARLHLYLALFLRRDYFFRPGSSPACFFLPQGLFRPPGFIPRLLFSSAGIISDCDDPP